MIADARSIITVRFCGCTNYFRYKKGNERL